jgi:hypothetical protein
MGHTSSLYFSPRILHLQEITKPRALDSVAAKRRQIAAQGASPGFEIGKVEPQRGERVGERGVEKGVEKGDERGEERSDRKKRGRSDERSEDERRSEERGVERGGKEATKEAAGKPALGWSSASALHQRPRLSTGFSRCGNDTKEAVPTNPPAKTTIQLREPSSRFDQTQPLIRWSDGRPRPSTQPQPRNREGHGFKSLP